MDAAQPGTGLIARLMDAAALRHQVLSHNLANQNTPGFRRQTVRFETLLQEAGARGAGIAARVRPEIVEDALTPAGPDGNNVHLELEHNAIRENELLYNTYAAILRANFDLLQSAIHTR
jgi:flagellar basal-body rod protein FlgB